MSETMSRIFEFNDGKSSKFWEVTQSGSTVKVRFGKTGTNGQSQEKVFADEAAASKHVQKLIAEKTGKGYVELGATPLTTVDVSGVAEVDKPTESKLEKTLTKPKTVKPAKSKNPAQDPDATPESLMALLDIDDATNRLLARHPKASADLLEKLSHSSDKATRQAVASNPNTPPEIFVRLGQQFPKEFLANPVLDLLLLVNPALMVEVPESLLIRLLKQADCPASMLTWAAAHEQAKVQLAVAMNPNSPEQALQRLRQSQHHTVQEAVQAKPGDTLGQDPEQAFEQAVRERIGSLKLEELEEAWASGDVGLAQWSALPLTFRLAKATNSDEFSPAAIVKLLRDTQWTLESLRNVLPNYRYWDQVAGDPLTPLPVLEMLASDPDIGVRGSVARNVSTSLSIKEQLLESLSKNSDYSVRREVANNPSTPVPILLALAEDINSSVRSGVAQNSATPMSVKVKFLETLPANLSLNQISSARRAVAVNPSAPLSVLEFLSKDLDRGVRSGIAKNPSTPVPILLALAKDTDSSVRLGVAMNPSSPVSLLLALADDTDGSVKVGVAQNSSTPVSVKLKLLETLSRDLSTSVRCAVATNPSVPLSFLEYLAKDSDREVRSGIAKNPSSPVPILLALAEDTDSSVRSCVAQNSSTPVAVKVKLLETLCNDSSETVRRAVAENQSTPVHVLEVLSRDSEKWWGSGIRMSVAKNPSTPTSILERLAGDSVGEVVTAVVGNPNTPLPVLIKLVSHKNLGVRQALADHAHRSPAIRQTLWKDTDEDWRRDVRRLVIACQGLTQEMLDEMVQWAVLERDLVALLEHPNLSVSNAELIADKLFNTPATSSAWYRRELAKASAEVRAAAQADAVLSYHGKDPNKAVLAKRPLAPVMALCSGPFIEPTRLVKVVGSTDWLVRAAVARNHGAPPNLLKKLSADSHPLVAALARRAQAGPVEPSPTSSPLPAQGLDLARAVTEVIGRLRTTAVDKPRLLIDIVSDCTWGDQTNVGEVLSALGWLGKIDFVFPMLGGCLGNELFSEIWETGSKAHHASVRKLLAQSPECPVDVLRMLANDEDLEVLFTAMDNQAFPLQERSQIIQGMLRLRGSRLMDVLKNPQAPLELLEAKAKNNDSRVRYAVADNPSTPVPVLEFLAKDSDLFVRRIVAENRSAPVYILDALSKSSDSDVLTGLAKNPSTPVSVLRILSKSADSDIRLSLIGNSSTPLDVQTRLLEKLVKNRENWVRYEVATNKSTSSNLLEILSNDSDVLVRKNVAKNPSAPVHVLQSLSNDSDSSVRSEVVRNRSTSVSELVNLSIDSDDGVRGAVALNHSTPEKILRGLSTDSNSDVRASAACNPSTSSDVLVSMSTDSVERVRGAVVRNSSTPVKVLESLSKDSDSGVRSGIAQNPSTPVYVLEELSKDSILEVRRGVAANPSAPVHLLSNLALDAAWQVSNAAAFNSSAPSEIRDQYIQGWVTRIQRAALREQSIREGKAPTPQAPITPADLVRALTWLDCIPADADNKALTKASRSKDWLTRLGAALHPSASEGILKLLRQDSDPDVAKAALLHGAHAVPTNV